jgi:hypothetical protein
MIVNASAPAPPNRVPKVYRNECITAPAGSLRARLIMRRTEITRKSLDWLGPTQVINFVVTTPGEAYDAHEQEGSADNGHFESGLMTWIITPSRSLSRAASQL